MKLNWTDIQIIGLLPLALEDNTLTIFTLAKDWLTLFAEVERLNKELEISHNVNSKVIAWSEMPKGWKEMK